MDGRGIEGNQGHVPGKDKAAIEGAGMKKLSQETPVFEKCALPVRAMPFLKADTTQVGGSHYKDKAIQPWDYIISNGLGYLEGNIVKYVSRYKDKNGLEDLKKARHYLDKLIETQEGK